MGSSQNVILLHGSGEEAAESVAGHVFPRLSPSALAKGEPGKIEEELAAVHGKDSPSAPWKALAAIRDGAVELARAHHERREALSRDRRYTEAGKREQEELLRAETAGKLDALRLAHGPLGTAAAQGLAAQEAAALDALTPGPPKVDGGFRTPEERAASRVEALGRRLEATFLGAEVRSWLRTMDDDKREALLLGSSDREVLRHVVTVPPALSGCGNELHGLLRTRAVEMAGGAALQTARSLVEASAVVEQALVVAADVVGASVVQP